MKTLKKDSPAAYNDVRFVMDLAAKKPGLTYECSTPGKATYFAQRCNKYRNLMRNMVAEQLLGTPGARAQTAYDCIVIRQINSLTGQPDRKGTILRFDHETPDGIIRDADGNLIEIPTTLFDSENFE